MRFSRIQSRRGKGVLRSYKGLEGLNEQPRATINCRQKWERRAPETDSRPMPDAAEIAIARSAG
jgi:hypothetical protein